jgi:mannose-6-phosphate isomerase-like protein (cupin superfamily)
MMRSEKPYHHRKLLNHSTLLSGHTPPDEIGFRSALVQIWYNNTEIGWIDGAPHMHARSDECFVVLQGRLVVEVEGERVTVGPREFCCFPRGVYHQIVDVDLLVESLMIRSPSVDDKVYRHETTDE